MLRTLAIVTTLAAAPAVLGADIPRHTPGIRIWTSGDDLVRRGERVRVYYRTERDAYVTIFRVDTDGHVRLIFPRSPDEENYGYGGATYTVSAAGNGTAFLVDDYAGVGYIFAIASTAPFDYTAIHNDGRWDLRAVSDGRIHGDPLTSLEELGAHLLPPSFADYDTHLLPYYVEQRYSYPRFVCYDCHAHVPYSSWDPYLAWCRRYTLVVWNDPYYYYPSYWYPARYYGGTRVVYTSPGGSRYVFKTRDNAAPGIDYRDRRTTPVSVAQGSGRRTAAPDDRGVRAADVGGIGSIPAPRAAGGRREAPIGGASGGDDRPGRDGRFGDAASGAVDNGGSDGRRRAGGDAQVPSSPVPAASPSDGGRRRSDNPPGIEIVPGPDRQSRPERPAQPSDGGRRSPEATQPVVKSTEGRPESRTTEPRPPRSDGATSRPSPIEVRRPDAGQPERPQESRPAREARPEAQPESRPAPERRPERAPESRPERAPESRPAPPPAPAPAPQPERSRPESRPAPAPERRQPESRPQSAPSQRESGEGLVRRRN